MTKYTYLVLVPAIFYKDHMIDMTKTIVERSKRPCYITLSKTAGMVLETLKDGGIMTAQFMFIDGISNAIFRQQDNENTKYLQYPLSLDELEKNITASVENGADAIIFDSLTALTTIKNQREAIAFISRMIAYLDSKKVPSIFLALLGDETKELVAHTSMCVGTVEERR